MRITAFTLSLLALSALATNTVHAGQTKQKPAPAPAHKTPAPAPAPKPVEKKPVEATQPRKALAVGAETDASISLPDTSGKQHSLKDYRGKIVVIDFWSSASPSYDKRLAQVFEEYGKKNVVFLAIASDKSDSDGSSPDQAKRIQDYLQKNNIAFPVLIDKGNVVADKFGAETTAHAFVIDAKGIVRYMGAIDDDPKGEHADKSAAYLRQALDAVIAGKDVPTPTTKPNGAPIQRAHHEAPADAGSKAPPAKK